MPIDRRKDERKNFRMDDCTGSFIVTDREGREMEVLNVNDVSISGIGLQLQETGFRENDNIRLIYEKDGLRITISTTIRWYSFISESEGCRLGLQFEPNQGDMNLLFFMALREHLDSFDHVNMIEKV